MKTGYEYWKDKKINCLGDSITFGHGDNGVSWVDHLRELMPEADIRKYGVCGSTVSIFSERDDSFVERMPQMQMDYDLCIVYGGVNDYNHSLPLGTIESRGTDTFYGAVRYLAEQLLAGNPKGELFFITPMKTRDFKGYPHWNAGNEGGWKLIDYRNAIMDVCREYSIPVLDFFSTSGITADIPEMKAYIQPDGLHPSRAGYERMTRKIYNFIVNTL